MFPPSFMRIPKATKSNLKILPFLIKQFLQF